MRLIDADKLDEEVMNLLISITGNPKMSTIVRECKSSFRRMIEEQPTVYSDEWIPVEYELPPIGERLLAIIKHHEWVSDYEADWVPESEKIRHPEYTEVCEITYSEGMWFYSCKEDDYEKDVAYIKPQKDITKTIDEIIAWKHLPVPYNPEK